MASGNGQYKYEGDEIEILCTALSKFMNLKLEDGEDPDALFFKADDLREVQPYGEKISDRAYKGAIVRVILNSYSDL